MQPDLDELGENMEDNEDAESTKSEVKLGKLQFSLDYDFQKGEVSCSTSTNMYMFVAHFVWVVNAYAAHEVRV